VLECAGDVCLYTLVVCSELLFVVAFSTCCNCCDSYFVTRTLFPLILLLYLESRLAKKHLNRLWDQWELEWTNLKAYAHGDGPHRLQVALRVLRQSFSAKAAYLSRCLPAHLAAPIAQRFHQRLVLPMLDNILGARTTAFVKLHATLPPLWWPRDW